MCQLEMHIEMKLYFCRYGNLEIILRRRYWESDGIYFKSFTRMLYLSLVYFAVLPINEIIIITFV